MFKKLISFFKSEEKAPASAMATGKRGAGVTRKPLPISTGDSKKKAQPAPPKEKKKSAEVLCGIDPKKMTAEQIKERLATLYKRHNQAAGSLNDELRLEAEEMLEAIVTCRQKYVDKPAPASPKKTAKK